MYSLDITVISIYGIKTFAIYASFKLILKNVNINFTFITIATNRVLRDHHTVS